MSVKTSLTKSSASFSSCKAVMICSVFMLLLMAISILAVQSTIAIATAVCVNASLQVPLAKVYTLFVSRDIYRSTRPASSLGRVMCLASLTSSGCCRLAAHLSLKPRWPPLLHSSHDALLQRRGCVRISCITPHLLHPLPMSACHPMNLQPLQSL